MKCGGGSCKHVVAMYCGALWWAKQWVELLVGLGALVRIGIAPITTHLACEPYAASRTTASCILLGGVIGRSR